MKLKTRTCTNPPPNTLQGLGSPCAGDNNETRIIDDGKDGKDPECRPEMINKSLIENSSCPNDGKWGSWSRFKCPNTCGSSEYRVRTRQCQFNHTIKDALYCVGDAREFSNVGEKKCSNLRDCRGKFESIYCSNAVVH